MPDSTGYGNMLKFFTLLGVLTVRRLITYTVRGHILMLLQALKKETKIEEGGQVDKVAEGKKVMLGREGSTESHSQKQRKHREQEDKRGVVG